MTSTEAYLELLLAKIMHELAYEIDAGYENDDIGLLADEDSTFLVFRRVFAVLQTRGVTVSGRVLHVQARIEKAYSEAFVDPLPPLDDDDEIF